MGFEDIVTEHYGESVARAVRNAADVFIDAVIATNPDQLIDFDRGFAFAQIALLAVRERAEEQGVFSPLEGDE